MKGFLFAVLLLFAFPIFADDFSHDENSFLKGKIQNTSTIRVVGFEGSGADVFQLNLSGIAFDSNTTIIKSATPVLKRFKSYEVKFVHLAMYDYLPRPQV